ALVERPQRPAQERKFLVGGEGREHAPSIRDRAVLSWRVAISLVLADDHRVVLEGLKALFAAEPDLRVIGEAHDGTQVAPLVESLRPDVLVLDLMLPGASGLDVLKQLRERALPTRTVILSMHAGESWVVDSLRAGAAGYVTKHAPARALLDAIRAVAAGGRYLAPPFTCETTPEWGARPLTAAATH